MKRCQTRLKFARNIKNNIFLKYAETLAKIARRSTNNSTAKQHKKETAYEKSEIFSVTISS